MNETWQQFLSAQGAVIEDGRTVGFGDPQAEAQAATAGCIIADLSHYALMQASGEEAQSFLQNQLSNDVRAVTADASQLAGYCSPKGRLLALFRLFKQQDQYYLILPAELMADTLKRLRMYVLRSKVTLEDVSDQGARFGIGGPESADHLKERFGDVPKADGGVVRQDQVSVIRLPGTKPRFEIHGPAEELELLWSELRTDCMPVGMDAWELQNIQAAVPQIYAATREAFVPQMVNLERLGGISYSKGCYPGQEIVARTHYLGKLKRRMYVGHIDSQARPQPGDELYVAGQSGGQAAGQLVDARPSGNGGYEALAVVQIVTAETHPLSIGAADGPGFTLKELPYPPPEQVRSS